MLQNLNIKKELIEKHYKDVEDLIKNKIIPGPVKRYPIVYSNPTTGVYVCEKSDQEFTLFSVINTIEKVKHTIKYGTCDNYQQVLEYHKDLLETPDKYYTVYLKAIYRKHQPKHEGFRYYKHGKYIGTQNPEYEYLYDDKHIDKIYCYHIHEMEKA